jgi:N-acetylglucosaminyl-diphospho-decaprenol L-rhamnosyltransferase
VLVEPGGVVRLAIIVVSWNVRDLLERCLHAVEASLDGSALEYRILVVDNASHDGTPAMVRRQFPHVELLETGANLGFAGGNNVGLRYLLGEMAEGAGGRGQGAGVGSALSAAMPYTSAPTPCLLPPDYVLLLNPDTEPVADAIPRLVRYLEEHPELVVVGPQLRYGDGSLQSSRRRFPTRLSFFFESTPLQQLWPNNPWVRHYHCDDQPDDQTQPVDWLVGAALLVRSDAIARAGLLDERFFMYSEEIEWQLRLQDGGPVGTQHALQLPLPSRIAYLPEAVIIHYEGKSSEQAVFARYKNFQQSKLLLARMRYGWGFAALLRGFIRLIYWYEMLVESAKWLLGHKPALRRQRIGVYWRILQTL